MTDIKKEFTAFEKYLKTYMKGMRVRNITRMYISSADEIDYSNYTIEQFIVLYKLCRMEELGVISREIADNLREILDMKRHIATIIGGEAKRELYEPSYRSVLLPKLHKTIDTIDSHLKEYHLTIDDINLVDMLDASIKDENKPYIKEENNIRVKRMD